MFKRICPKCFTRWYSEASGDEVWICEVCKSEIPKSQEVVNWMQSDKKAKEDNMLDLKI